jgi:hypothetical protein
VDTVRLVQNVVDDAVKYLTVQQRNLGVHREGRRKLPVNKDGAFCAAVEFNNKLHTHNKCQS